MHAWLRNALSRKSFVENSAHLQAWHMDTAPPGRNVLGTMGNGAGDGNRTHVLSLGSSGPTIERRPHGPPWAGGEDLRFVVYGPV